MNHQYLLPQPQPQFAPQSYTASNRFIYVKHNFINPNPVPIPTTKVLINPHFTKKVFVNPKFNHLQGGFPSSVKPKIHVNPDVLKTFASSINKGQNECPKTPLEKKTTAVISTRNKFIRISTPSKKGQNLLHTKYKIVKSVVAKNSSIHKFKSDEKITKFARTPRLKPFNTSNMKISRTKYVYLNRFLSIDIIAKNVLLKKNANVTKPGFVKINGILYRKSPNSLKKASDASIVKLTKPPVPVNRVLKDKRRLFHINNRRSFLKSPHLNRSKRKTPSTLRKCNMPCLIYRRSGKCPGRLNGTCIRLHNPEQIILCPRFLQGACRDAHCPLSHKVSQEKMPTCKYYLHGLCSKDDCAYLHVKISPKADICRDFLEGYCSKGAKCDKRHQFLCPDFEKTKRCVKRRCPYPHGNVRENTRIINTLAKRCSTKKVQNLVKNSSVSNTTESNRYYKDLDVKETPSKSNSGQVIKTVSKERPKLGALPAFIPFFDST